MLGNETPGQNVFLGLNFSPEDFQAIVQIGLPVDLEGDRRYVIGSLTLEQAEAIESALQSIITAARTVSGMLDTLPPERRAQVRESYQIAMQAPNN